MNVDVVHGDRPKHPLVGTVVEPYAILDVIAAGGMGVVFKARHKLTDRVVAMKLLPSELARDESNVERVKIEAKALAQLKHPNIVTTFDFGFTAMQEPFIVMEYVAGESLKEVLDREVLLPVDRALKIFLQAVDGMRYAHSAKILHRDLKPHNIMVSNEPEADHVKILDFGVAKLAEYTQKITRTGEVVGSPLYMSPEQCTGRPTDHRCDIYSIGVMMFETLTGNPPFRGENYISTVHLKCTKLAPSFKDVVPGRVFPERLEMIVLKCLEIEPDKRYSTMAELKADLELVAGVIPRVERAKTNQGLPAQPTVHQNAGTAPAKADEIGWQPKWAGGESSAPNPDTRAREAQFSDSIVTSVSDSTDGQNWRGPSSPNLSDDNWGNTDFSKVEKNQLAWSAPGTADDDNQWIPATPPSAAPPATPQQKPLTQTQGLASLSAALEASSIGAGDMLNIKPGGFKTEGAPADDDITGDKPLVDLEQTKGPAPVPLKKDESGDSHFVLTWDQKTGPSWSATTATPQRPKAPMGSMAGTRTRMPGMDTNAIANAAVSAADPVQQATQEKNVPQSGSSPKNGESEAPDTSQNAWGGEEKQTDAAGRFNAAAHGWTQPTATGSHQTVAGPAGSQPQTPNQGMTGTQHQMREGEPSPARQPHPGFPQAQPAQGQSAQDSQGFQLPGNPTAGILAGFPPPQAQSQQNFPTPSPNTGFPPPATAYQGFPQTGQSPPPQAPAAQMTESETGVKHMAPWQDKTPPVGPVGGPISPPLFPPSPVAQLAASLMDDESTKLTTEHSSETGLRPGGNQTPPLPSSVQAPMAPQNAQSGMPPHAPPLSPAPQMPPSSSSAQMPPSNSPLHVPPSNTTPQAQPTHAPPLAPPNFQPGPSPAPRPGMSTPQPGMPASMQPNGGHSLMSGSEAASQPMHKTPPQPTPFEEPKVLGSNEPSPYQGTTAGAAVQKTTPMSRPKPDWHTDSDPVDNDSAPPAANSAIKQFAERMKTNMPEPASEVSPDTGGRGFKSYEPVSLAELNAIKTPAPAQPKPTTEGLSNAIPPGHQTTGSAPVYNKKTRSRKGDESDNPGPNTARSGAARGAGSSMRFNTSRGGSDTKKTVLITLVAVAIVAVIGIAGFILLQHNNDNKNQTATVNQALPDDKSSESEVTQTSEVKQTSRAQQAQSTTTSAQTQSASKPVQRTTPPSSARKEVPRKAQVAKTTKKTKKPKAVAKTPAPASDTPTLPRRRRAYSTYDSYYSDGN